MSITHLITAMALIAAVNAAEPRRPKLIDAHVHHNGDPAFLAKFHEKLEAVDGQALLITAEKDVPSVKAFIAAHPNRFFGIGQMSLDHPDAIKLIDAFHNAGFRGFAEAGKCFLEVARDTNPLEAKDAKRVQ